MDVVRTRPLQPLNQLTRWSLASAICVLLAISLLMAVRRFIGQQHPLAPGATLLLALLLAGGAALWRLGWQRVAGMPSTYRSRLTVLLAPTAVLLLFALACFTSGNSTAALVFAWLIVVGGEAWTLRRFLPARRDDGGTGRSSFSHRTPAGGAGRDVDRLPATLPENATQSLVHSIEDGAQVVAGTLRARFQPGERVANVHVGFCPPLPAAPELECEQTDGPEAEIRPAQLVAHGARLEVRLKRRSDVLETVEFDFHASASVEPRSHAVTEEA